MLSEILQTAMAASATTALWAAGLYLARELIVTRLTKSVQHEYDSKLEALRAELRESETRLRASLDAKESEIESLRRGALSSIERRRSALDARRLQAADNLWRAVVQLAQMKRVAEMIRALNFEAIAERIKERPSDSDKFRLVFQPMFKPSLDAATEGKVDHVEAQRERPFVSESAWALYSAYAAVCGMGAARASMLSNGFADAELLKSKELNDIVKGALPDHTAYIDKYPDIGAFYVFEELERRLISELQRLVVEGIEPDSKTVARAAEVVKASQSFQAQLNIKEAAIPEDFKSKAEVDADQP